MGIKEANSIPYTECIHTTCVPLNNLMFTRGQTYVALSKAPDCDSVEIICLTWDSFTVDNIILAEYNCLAEIAATKTYKTTLIKKAEPVTLKKAVKYRQASRRPAQQTELVVI